MKIGLFSDTYTPDINGVVSSTVILKKYLEKLGHEVYVVTNHSGTRISNEGTIIRLPGMRLKMLYGYNLSSPINQRATELIEGLGLDVIHLQTNFGVGLYGQHMARHLGIPCVMTYHTMFEDYTHYINPFNLEKFEKISREVIRKISKIIFNSAQAVIAPSEKTRASLEHYGVMAPVSVIPSGLELERFHPDRQDPERLEALQREYRQDPDALYFLYLGRMADEKLVSMLIEAFGKTEKNYHLILAGDGPEAGQYRQQAQDMPHPERFHFTGAIPPEEVPLYYALADAFVSASLSETQGITYLEALASGRMIFARRDPVLSALVDEGESGYFFDDADELIEKCSVFEALDPGQRKENLRHCLDKAAPYDGGHFAASVQEVYQKSIDNYMTTYRVVRARQKDDFVELILEHDQLEDNLELWIPYEDYFRLEITDLARLEHYLVEYYKNRQNRYKAFYHLRKKLLTKEMSAQMAREYLQMRFSLTREQIEKIIDELIERELINDETYAMEYASLRHDMGYSKKQIAMKLVRKGISSGLIAQAIDQLEEETEQKNAQALARRLARSVKNQSSRLKRQTIYKKLLAKGFSSETASQSLEELDLDQDQEQALRLCFEKACRLYKDLEPARQSQKIKLYCMKKGFSIEEIDEIMDQARQQELLPA